MDPFLSAAEFAQWSKTPAWATNSLAEALLQVVSDWIRDNKPNITDDDVAARAVCCEVTRDSLLYGEFGPVVAFGKTVGHRTRSGTIDRTAVEKFVTDRHKRMLGLSIAPRPAYHFGD